MIVAEGTVEIVKLQPYLRVEDLKTHFGLDRQKVLRLLAAKAITGSKPGKHWIISTVSVLRYLKRYENRRPSLYA